MMPNRAITDRLEAIWEKHLPETRRQLECVIRQLRAADAHDPANAEVVEAAEYAHRIVGLAGMYGRPELAYLARHAERALRGPDRLPVGSPERTRIADQLEPHLA